MLVEIMAVILNYYGVQGASRDVVEASLSVPELRELVNRQLTIQGDHDFLLGPLQATIVLLDQLMTQMKKPTALSPTPPSTPVSAPNGALVSTS